MAKLHTQGKQGIGKVPRGLTRISGIFTRDIHKASSYREAIMRHRSLLKKTLSPLGKWGQSFIFSVLLTISAILVVVTRYNPSVVSHTRAFAMDLVTPVLESLAKPMIAAQNISKNLRSYKELQSEVMKLRQYKTKLETLRTETETLVSENMKLRQLVSLVKDREYNPITVRVVSDPGSSFSRSLLINAGSDHKLRVGMGATVANHLAGRIVDVGRKSSRVLLLTDINSRIPVIVERTGVETILAGNNSPTIDLLHLSPTDQAQIKVGDRLITSGGGGVFPYGILAGRVIRVTNSGVSAKPIVDWNRTLFMNILDYNICHFMIEDENCVTSNDN